MQHARQRTGCSQIHCQGGADLIVEEDSSTLVTVQQLPIAAGNDKISPSLVRFLLFVPSIVLGCLGVAALSPGSKSLLPRSDLPHSGSNSGTLRFRIL